VTVVALCLFPLIPWLLVKPLEMRFGTTTAWLTSIGQTSALVGLAMFSVSLILIARIPFLEPFFGGLDRIFQAHRHLGVFGFLLMLIHPLALAVRFVPVSVADAARFLLPSLSEFAKTLGIVALLLMMGLIGATLFAHWRYQVLLATHKVLGIAFMLGVIHALLIPSDISGNKVLAVYSIGLALLGISAYLYRTVFKKVIPKHAYVVKEVRALSHQITEVVLDPVNEPLTFTPGQFVFVSFKNTNVSREVHPFSISSGVHERELRLTIKSLGDWTSDAQHSTAGATVDVEGPFGGFTEERAVTDSEVWVAGGIGITPFLSRARSLAHTGTGKRIDFYYTAQTREELLFIQELTGVAKQHPNVHFIPHVSSEEGFLTASLIQQTSGSLGTKDVFVCGPKGMMDSIIRQCKELGVPSSHIHAEEFSML
jgi:predicted ferric reductase